VEVAEFIAQLVGALGDDADEIAQVVFLQILLGEVLDVLLGEGQLGLDDDLVGVGLVRGDLDELAEVAGLAFNLDALSQELGETRAIDNVVFGGLGQVDLCCGLRGTLLLAALRRQRYPHSERLSLSTPQPQG